MITDLTQGKTSKVLLMFTLPLLGSVVFQQFYNISDSIIAGRFAGEDALAAIGVSYPITMIFMAVAMGCNIGGSVVISQLFGSKHMSDMKTAVNTSFVMSAVVSLVLLLFGVIFCNPMLGLLNTPENIFSDGKRKKALLFRYFPLQFSSFQIWHFYFWCHRVMEPAGSFMLAAEFRCLRHLFLTDRHTIAAPRAERTSDRRV